MPSLIKFEHVSFAYDAHPILRDVSFEIKDKEFIGLIGPNGGGKTTLLKLIMGFLKPSVGTVEVLGKSPELAHNPIAYVPQTLRFDRLFPISVMELVLQGRLSRLPWYGVYSAEDHKKALEALEMVGMLSFKDSPFGNLSGGQAQRALIARALVSEPKLLLLDEPTASVDNQAENDIHNILRELQGSITIIMVTHDLKATIDLVERVLCVQGNVISLEPQEVCKHFAFGLYHTPLTRFSG